MDRSLRDRRRRTRFTVAAMTVAVSVAGAACSLIALSRDPNSEPTRARAFVTTFDRLLIAGFLAETVSDRGRAIDLNEETARLLRMTLQSRASMTIFDSQPVHLPQTAFTSANPEKVVFNDVAFWKRLGEEYRQPLILTGTVEFERAGAQSVERQIGPRAVTVWRPRFRLGMRLVFISGRTGEMLESLSLGPVTLQAPDERTSALALYFQLMDRITPAVLAVFGVQDSELR
jgi:hypothetical protein